MLLHFPTHFSKTFNEQQPSVTILCMIARKLSTLSCGIQNLPSSESIIIPKCLISVVGLSTDFAMFTKYPALKRTMQVTKHTRFADLLCSQGDAYLVWTLFAAQLSSIHVINGARVSFLIYTATFSVSVA